MNEANIYTNPAPKISEKPEKKKKFLYIALGVIIAGLLTIFFSFYDQISYALSRAPIAVNAKLMVGDSIKKKYNYNNPISYANAEYIKIVNNNNFYISSGNIDFMIGSDKNISLAKGLISFDINNKTILNINNKQIDLNPPLKFIYNDSERIIVVVAGKLTINGKEIHENQMIKYADLGFEVSEFDRKNYSGDDYRKLFEALKKLDKLPTNLTDLLPPELSVSEPGDNVETNDEKITVKGNTEIGAALKINGDVVLINDKGEFFKETNLAIGKNKIIIESKDNAGNKSVKEIRIKRNDPCSGVTECGKCGNPACRSTEKISSNNESSTPVSSCSSSFASKVLGLINSYRAENGKNALTLENALNVAACNHSNWMNTTGTFSHTGENGSQFYERCIEAGTSCDGENLATGSTDVNLIMEMWKASQNHNENMLGDHSYLGVGLTDTYVTTVFR